MADLRVDHGVSRTDEFDVPARGNASTYRAGGKRVCDIALAILILPMVAPVIGALALAVKRQDGANPFFGHTRVGRDGKRFRCWKIRTMVADAQERLVEHLANDPEAAAEWEAERKLTNDPRITRLGAFLRKTSLDELPQIWNVLRGDMSFVGPRPVPEDELEKYGHARGAYLAVRPGVTGMWQVSGRNDVAYDERVRMDVEYQRAYTLPMDFGILLRTAGVVVKPTGK
ncbi:sugar transferase [Rhodovulum sp. DZ06]|uniref:sugar transferase n=1 Tax=Rhodovulum sp. DZ06 TaxID=3425126 RepID=UPI003D33D443